MIISVTAVILVIAAILFSYRAKSTKNNQENEVTYKRTVESQQIEMEFNRLLFKQELYMTLIVKFESYYVQYLFDNKISNFGVYCECISDNNYNELEIKDQPDFEKLIQLNFNLSQEFVTTDNYNKLYTVRNNDDHKLILDELYFIMNNVYHISKSTPITFVYF